METSVEKISNLERRIKVSIPADEIDKKTMQKLEGMKSKVKLSGFRPGKVPLSVVKQRFGNSARNEVIADAIRDSYFEILKQENLHPAGQPHIEPSASKFGEPLKYVATLEILPEIILASMDGVKVEKLTSEVTDEDVEDMVQKLLKQHANWTEVDRDSKNGDQVVIDFEGKIKNETFKGGAGKDFKFELGAGTMLSDFEKPLIGAKAGSNIKFKIKFPQDYTDKDVAGKKADFEVTVHKVLASELPKLDKEFFEKVGIKEGDEKTLRTELRKNMQHQLQHGIATHFKNQLVDKFLELNPIELPKVLVDNEISRLQNQMKQQFAQYTSGSAEGLPDIPRTEVEKPAQRNVSLGLLSSKIIEQQNIKVDPKQVRAKVEELAATYEKPSDVINWYYQDKKRLTQIESLILEEQVMQELEKQVKVVEKKATFQEVLNPGVEKND